MNIIVRTQAEIDEQVNWAVEGQDKGGRYPGMSYEDGILEMYRWLIGDNDDKPNQED